LLAQRLRQSAKRGAQISILHSADDDLLIKLTARAIAAPSQLPAVLAQIVKVVCQLKGVAADAALAGVTVSAEAQAIAQSLVAGSNAGILLGNFAQQHPQAATLHALGRQLASASVAASASSARQPTASAVMLPRQFRQARALTPRR